MSIALRSVVGLSAALAAGTADADICSSLQQQYIASSPAAGSRGPQVDVAALNNSLQIAQASAQSNHCSGGFFGLFGPPPSPACPLIVQQVNSLQGQIRAARNTRGGYGGGFFGSVSYADPGAQDYIRQELQANGCAVPGSGGGGGGGGAYRTLCVRSCDGYYFPLEYGVSSDSFNADAQACQTMYGGNGQAQLFVMPSDGDVADATPVDGGMSYGAQPYAFAYRSNYNPSCVSQLQGGVTALESLGTPNNFVTVAITTPGTIAPAAPPPGVPIPKLRPSRFEDPETLANSAGGLSPQALPALTASAAPTGLGGVRIVGAGYYNQILQQQAEVGVTNPVPTLAPQTLAPVSPSAVQ